MIARIQAIALALCASGCATIVQGSYERVAFETEPAGATVRAYSQACTTPCSLRLKRNRNVEAEIRKPGYEPETVLIRYELDPWILGNIVFLPLAPLGGVVDIVSGAGFQLYPEHVAIPLRPVDEGRSPPRDGRRPHDEPEQSPTDSGDDEGWKPIPELV